MPTSKTDWTVTVATFGGLGQKLPAPGTFGTLLGIGWYFAAFYPLDNLLGQILLAAITITLAVKVTEHAAEPRILFSRHHHQFTSVPQLSHLRPP